MNLLGDKLKAEGYEVVMTREPGGISISEKIRDIILDTEHTMMDSRTEALLYAAARRQHLVRKFNQPLMQGKLLFVTDLSIVPWHIKDMREALV